MSNKIKNLNEAISFLNKLGLDVEEAIYPGGGSCYILINTRTGQEVITFERQSEIIEYTNNLIDYL